MFSPSVLINPCRADEVKFVEELKGDFKKPVDVAVSKQGLIVVLDEELSKVFVFDGGHKLLLTFGGLGDAGGSWKQPRSIAVAVDGKIFVADSGNNRVQAFDQAGNFLFQFGASGNIDGLFKNPIGVAVDHFGFVYVADRGNRKIQVFSPNGVFLYAFALRGEPGDVGVDPQGNVYVLFPESDRVIKYSAVGKKLLQISSTIRTRGIAPHPVSLAVDDKGDVYVADAGQNNVRQFDMNNQLLLSFGSQGTGRGQFVNIAGIFIDPSDQVFISDPGNQRIQVVKTLGSNKPAITPLAESPLRLDFYTSMPAEPSLLDLCHSAGNLYAASEKGNHVLIKGKSEGEVGQPASLNRPAGVYAALDGRMWVADTANQRIQVFNKDGTPNYQFGKSGNRAGEFNSPHGVAVNSKGIIFVADTNNNRIQIFNNDGIFLTSFGEMITVGWNDPIGGDRRLRLPTALAIDSRDRVYVIDSQGSRVVVFSRKGEYLGQIGKDGRSFGSLGRLVDLTLDENDNLYLVDQTNAHVKIIDPRGNLILTFGSLGEGRGYFKEVSAIAVAGGKIYVADYLSPEIQVFRFAAEGLDTSKRIYSSQMAPLPDTVEENEVSRYSSAKRTAMEMAMEDIGKDLPFTRDELKGLVKVESIETTKDMQVKVTLSLPRNILDKIPSPAAKTKMGKKLR